MHTSVLLHESIDNLALKDGDVVVDGTVGAGGHASEICKRAKVHLFAFDMDTDALKRSEVRIKETGCEPTMIEGNFSDIKAHLAKRGVTQVDKILLDLGLSSYQLGESGRGFSFKYDEPLLMTMKKNPSEEDVTAYDIVNTWSETTLADIIYGFGEERYARRIAKAIVEAREHHPIERTGELVDIITNAVPKAYARGKIHPATRTFQAIRIAVNRELELLPQALADMTDMLAPGGRLAVITFHSLEDRIVKTTFMQESKNGRVIKITKKPIVPSFVETKENPRSRSAKLRVVEKVLL
jgi:16S rRNA (cytosine1402-N4)-methyltransferase